MKIDIINRALVKLGQSTISSVNEMPWGAISNIVYEDVRRCLLSMYSWRFAIKESLLAPLDEQPFTALYKYKFQKPVDCLTFLTLGYMYKMADLRDIRTTSGERYFLMGKNILANINPLPIVYVADVEDVTLFSPLFVEAFVAKLAAELTIKIHQNPQLLQVYERDFNNYMTLAIQNNEIMQDTQSLCENSWVSIRGAVNNGY